MVARTSVCSAALGVFLLAADAGADVLEQAKAAVVELGMQTEAALRQRAMERMMIGLGLAMVGGRLVRYRVEDKACREPEGPRCASAAGAGTAGLAVGVLLMTVLPTAPAAPSVSLEPQPGGVAVAESSASDAAQRGPGRHALGSDPCFTPGSRGRLPARRDAL